MAKRFESTWARVRVVITPREMMGGLAHGLPEDLEAFGLLMRLATYAAYAGLPVERSRMARIVRTATRTINRLWPQMQPFFELTEDGKHWNLLPCDWMKVQIVSAERRDLTSLIDALVDYWGPRCVYCGVEGDLEIEHVVPLARGGTNEITNLTVACHDCNSKKRTRTAEEFGHPHIHEKASRIQ